MKARTKKVLMSIVDGIGEIAEEMSRQRETRETREMMTSHEIENIEDSKDLFDFYLSSSVNSSTFSYTMREKMKKKLVAGLRSQDIPKEDVLDFIRWGLLRLTEDLDYNVKAAIETRLKKEFKRIPELGVVDQMKANKCLLDGLDTHLYPYNFKRVMEDAVTL